MANRRGPLRAPIETSANTQCPPRKETRLPSGRCVHRAASSRMYFRPGEMEGLKKTRATTSKAFWAAGNRRSCACADSRVHCLPDTHGTQPRDYNHLTRPAKGLSVINPACPRDFECNWDCFNNQAREASSERCPCNVRPRFERLICIFRGIVKGSNTSKDRDHSSFFRSTAECVRTFWRQSCRRLRRAERSCA